MARLAVLTDRLPDDPSWKGAYTWEIIRALSESQHEVVVFTPEDPERIAFTHPRLTVARPAPNWNAERLPRWAQALIQLRPEVIHTFALKPSTLWPALSVWPYLEALCKVLPGVVRVSTMFEPEDFKSAAAWHAGAQRWTVFSQAHAAAARRVYAGPVEVAPFESLNLSRVSDPDPADLGAEIAPPEHGSVLVPAPISEWRDPRLGLYRLADHLQARPGLNAWINGGWGELSLNERRAGWQSLQPVAARVRLLEAQTLAGFVTRAATAGSLWLESLPLDSWRFLMSAQIGQQLGKERIGESRLPLGPASSTANFLSRIYLS